MEGATHFWVHFIFYLFNVLTLLCGCVIGYYYGKQVGRKEIINGYIKEKPKQ